MLSCRIDLRGVRMSLSACPAALPDLPAKNHPRFWGHATILRIVPPHSVG